MEDYVNVVQVLDQLIRGVERARLVVVELVRAISLCLMKRILRKKSESFFFSTIKKERIYIFSTSCSMYLSHIAEYDYALQRVLSWKWRRFEIIGLAPDNSAIGQLVAELVRVPEQGNTIFKA